MLECSHICRPYRTAQSQVLTWEQAVAGMACSASCNERIDRFLEEERPLVLWKDSRRIVRRSVGTGHCCSRCCRWGCHFDSLQSRPLLGLVAQAAEDCTDLRIERATSGLVEVVRPW